eukprot:CAMPEP_0204585132 /NCGR_PEP_ID=MMETSP0661-20131031/46744_1 /ASSEMBLY_ACC=CAM_ASM_000606 /TAXON_ID=109239 /ORGANISM="Alexandrium margalefi, Strain AMGDE01CS-322" /LENGTH=56 /DNA_ID=CAMNT_0051594661 /DNA_START=103 /DNA_END=273 /DNA_ORIENTATION=-
MSRESAQRIELHSAQERHRSSARQASGKQPAFSRLRRPLPEICRGTGTCIHAAMVL